MWPLLTWDVAPFEDSRGPIGPIFQNPRIISESVAGTEKPIQTQNLVNSVKSKEEWIKWALEYMEKPKMKSKPGR